MNKRFRRIGACVLLAVGALPLLQFAGCTSNLLYEAVVFEVQNTFSGLIFNQTQILFENLLGL